MTEDEIVEATAAGEHNHIQIEMRRMKIRAHPDWEAMPEDYKAGARKCAASILAALTAKGYVVVPVDCLEAFNRQADNMAFVVNHCDLKNWYDKFKSELEQDRATFAARAMIAVKE
jgi:hypothetical protein